MKNYFRADLLNTQDARTSYAITVYDQTQYVYQPKNKGLLSCIQEYVDIQPLVNRVTVLFSWLIDPISKYQNMNTRIDCNKIFMFDQVEAAANVLNITKKELSTLTLSDLQHRNNRFLEETQKIFNDSKLPSPLVNIMKKHVTKRCIANKIICDYLEKERPKNLTHQVDMIVK